MSYADDVMDKLIDIALDVHGEEDVYSNRDKFYYGYVEKFL